MYGYYSGPAYIPDPELRPRFPLQKETQTLDAGFDQSRDLKRIFDHYTAKGKLSAELISQLSPADFHANVNKKKLRNVYSKISPSVVSVSSFVGVKRRLDCSGVIIDWNPNENEATILTSAKLLWSPKSITYDFHLIVRLADGTLLLAKEDHVDYYYNLLLLKIKSSVELKALDLRCREDVVDGMDVIAFGRSFYTCSLFDSSGKLYLEYPYFGCIELLRSTCCVSKICEGGPLTSPTGSVVGISFFDDQNCAHPLPTPIVLMCLEMWRSFSTVVRPWFGLSVVDADQLSYKIWETLNLTVDQQYVVVKEVYKGSRAEENGVCSGDIVTTCNGTPIQSAKEFSQLLAERSRTLSMSGDLVQQSFWVSIKPYDGRADKISIEADNVAVDDPKLTVCWPPLDADWFCPKNGSQENPRINIMIPRDNIIIYEE